MIKQQNEEESYLFELYDIPNPGSSVSPMPRNKRELKSENSKLENVQISELWPLIPCDCDVSVTPMLLKDRKQPPLTVYLCMTSGVRVCHFWPFVRDSNLEPCWDKRPSQQSFFYDIEYMARFPIAGTPHPHHAYDDGDWATMPEGRIRVLPGATRSIYYKIPPDSRSTKSRVLDLYTYWNAYDMTTYYKRETIPSSFEALLDEYEQALIEARLLEEQPPAKRHKVDFHFPEEESLFPTPKVRKRTVIRPLTLDTGFMKRLRESGMRAMCWDESTGRVVISLSDCRFRIMDFAHTRRPGVHMFLILSRFVYFFSREFALTLCLIYLGPVDRCIEADMDLCIDNEREWNVEVVEAEVIEGEAIREEEVQDEQDQEEQILAEGLQVDRSQTESEPINTEDVEMVQIRNEGEIQDSQIQAEQSTQVRGEGIEKINSPLTRSKSPFW